MFWDIFINSLALILAILVIGWIAAMLADRCKTGESDG